jgi:hypothetical protein
MDAPRVVDVSVDAMGGARVVREIGCLDGVTLEA